MGLYTSDRLKAMFEASKERHQQEREQRKRDRQTQYQQLCKQADQLLKKAQEDAKTKKMEELQALAKKTSQKQNKIPSAPIFIYHSNLVERTSSDRDLYTTREELMKAEERCEGRINWEVWNKLVKETRRQIKEMMKDYVSPVINTKKNNHKYTVYAYDNKLNLIGEYSSTNKCGKAFGLNSRIIGYWIEQGKPHKKLGITFLKHKLSI